jgi:hypothetical protein
MDIIDIKDIGWMTVIKIYTNLTDSTAHNNYKRLRTLQSSALYIIDNNLYYVITNIFMISWNCLELLKCPHHECHNTQLPMVQSLMLHFLSKRRVNLWNHILARITC